MVAALCDCFGFALGSNIKSQSLGVGRVAERFFAYGFMPVGILVWSSLCVVRLDVRNTSCCSVSPDVSRFLPLVAAYDRKALGGFTLVAASHWSSSDRRSRLPRDWPRVRQVVLNRDGRKCQWRLADGSTCGCEATDVDHIVRGDDHSFSNLRSLCREHHARKSAHEGAAAHWAAMNVSRSKFREGRTPKHPGVL